MSTEQALTIEEFREQMSELLSRYLSDAEDAHFITTWVVIAAGPAIHDDPGTCIVAQVDDGSTAFYAKLGLLDHAANQLRHAAVNDD